MVRSSRNRRLVGMPGKARCRAQRGVVLIVALVVLVAMSMGGIAIMRSVDTSTLIAGNIAFKSRTRQGADAGIESAVTWIAANQSSLMNDNSASGGAGFYSSVSTTTPFVWQDSSSWTNAKLVGTDAAGNTIHYVIHRLCNLPGLGIAEPNQLCATDAGAGGTTYEAPAEGASNVGGGAPFTAKSKLYLRVIVRSTGPRNAVSYVQSMILVST